MRGWVRCSCCEAGPQRWGAGRELSRKVGAAQVQPRVPCSFCLILRTAGAQCRTGRNKWWEWVHLWERSLYLLNGEMMGVSMGPDSMLAWQLAPRRNGCCSDPGKEWWGVEQVVAAEEEASPVGTCQEVLCVLSRSVVSDYLRPRGL